MRSLLLLSSLFASLSLAQNVVTSHGPSSVSVTMYQAPERGEAAIDRDNPQGFALITETREVELPAGVVTIRFEGVASGIEPVSAMVQGVSVNEKNRDRRLLSQRGLLDAFTGQSVVVRRTDKATGRATEESGTIGSAPDGLILQTASGYESLYCTGLNQTLVFPNQPADLTAKPTLSVTTQDQPGGKQSITLSYLASRFDWQANYVGELSADLRHVNLLGWMTMASGDQTSFVDANAFAVAGKAFRANTEEESEEMEPHNEDAGTKGIEYRCWPRETTSDVPLKIGYQAFEGADVLVDAPMMLKSAMTGMELNEMVVTGARIAQREDLGDLKLYRIPFSVTVAAQSQKQVAFLAKPKVQGQMIYRSHIDDSDVVSNKTVDLLYRFRNDSKSGLGEALPSGQVTMFQDSSGRRMLVGEAAMTAKAVNEEVELEMGQASNVSVTIDENSQSGKGWRGYTLTVANANPFTIAYEAEFPLDIEDLRLERFSARLVELSGKRVWRVTVPANARKSLAYRAVDATR